MSAPPPTRPHAPALLALTAVFALGVAAARSGAAPATPKPNILLIYLDDFGWRDAGFAGSDFYETPHLDALAAAGMVFTDAYAGAANCAPSRACLLSGQYSPRHQVFNVGTGPRGKPAHRRLQHIPGTATLRPDIVTWAAAAKSVGYTTATMGKWHLSDDPLPYGFDLNIGGTHSGGPPKGYFPPHGKAPGLGDRPEGEYLTDHLSTEAARFIATNAERPWLLYLTHFAVHTPLQAKAADEARFKAKPKGDRHHHVTMAAMIKSVDDGVGEIVAALREHALLERTLILFTSDNGGYGPATTMRPLKGYKGTYYEGGIRVPFFATWPGVIAPGSRCSTPITAVDLHPTLCELTGATPPVGQERDGVSLVPLFKGETVAGRALFWHFPAYLQSYQRFDEQPDPLFRARPCGVVRDGDWKLIEYFEDGRVELFHLRDDIGEAHDLASDQPDRARALREKLAAWREATGAPVPTEANPAYDAAAERAAIAKLRGTDPKPTEQ